MSVTLGDGEAAPRELPQTSELDIEANQVALDFLTRWFLARREKEPKPPWWLDSVRRALYYLPATPIDWRGWEGLLSALAGRAVDPRQIRALGFPAGGEGAPSLAIAGRPDARELVLSLRMLSLPWKSDEAPLAVPAAFAFRVSPEGRLILAGIRATGGAPRDAEPGLMPGVASAEASVRLALLAMLGNQALQRAQKDARAVAFRIEEAGAEPRLVVTLTR